MMTKLKVMVRVLTVAQRRWWIGAVLIMLAIAACGGDGTEEAPEAATLPPPTSEPTATVAIPATLEPISTEVIATATAEGPALPEATDTPEVEPTVVEATAPPPEEFAPGQRASDTLETGDRALYPFLGIQFDAVVLFVEPEDELDVSVNVWRGALELDDEPAGDPLAAADFGDAGRPELLVFSPREDGAHTIAVQAENGTAGDYNIYMFDARTGAPGVELQTVTLDPGGSVEIPFDLAEAQPLVVIAEPVDQGDVVLTISAAGESIATADFGGDGSAEALFVTPLRPTDYTIIVQAGADAALTADVAIAVIGPEQ
ncbi:MAG: hypothetical protein R3300_13850 [Candidatus Promineifilaceae bacterium]|nr:hypothetical protein [Candidatus Promineifilaceae bacterium]